MPISLNEVVEHFSKTAPPKRKLSLGINDGPGGKKAKESGTEDSESDSSSGEDDTDANNSIDSNKNEVEVSFGVFTSQGQFKLVEKSKDGSKWESNEYFYNSRLLQMIPATVTLKSRRQQHLLQRKPKQHLLQNQ